MSLKAKLEAVIYAAEEPVTLAQLAQIFAADALEWQASQAAAAAEASAEMAGEDAGQEHGALLGAGLEMLPVADTAAMTAQAGQEMAAAALTNTVAEEDGAEVAETAPAAASEAVPETAGGDSEPADGAGDAGEPVDAEAAARRLARQRDREIKAILKQILDELVAASESDERGIEIREIAGGYRLATKPECHDAVRLFVKSLKPPMKLSLPALETLAVVAYKQPVTAPEVSEIRGVEAGGVLGSLLARKLIATAGRKQVIGRPILYKTTKEFLLRFGLKDVTELPSMEEFEKMAAAEIEEMEPEAVAADAARAAQEAAEGAEPIEAAGDMGENAPSGIEFAGAGEAEEAATAPTERAPEEQAPEESPESPTDATSAELLSPSNEPDAELIEASAAPPAEPESHAPAENETHPHADEVQEENGA